MSSQNQYFSTSLEKGLKILSLFDTERPSLTQTTISRAIGLNMTSTYRFVNTLVHLGYLEKQPKTKEIRLGIRSLALGANIIRTIDELQLLKKLVDDVHDRYNLTIDVGFAIENSMMRIYHRQAKETLTYNLPPVARNAFHNTSVGKAYLSVLPKDKTRQLVDTMKLEAKTNKTITNKEDLIAEIEIIRQRGYSMCVEEFIPGLIAIGAPLINATTGKALGGVSFHFSIIQVSAKEVESNYAVLIRELSRSISEILNRDDYQD